MSVCQVAGCPKTAVIIERVGLEVRPLAAKGVQLMPMDIPFCEDHTGLLRPSAGLSLYSLEWDGMSEPL